VIFYLYQFVSWGDSMLIVAEEWKNVYPGAHVGLMAVRNVANPQQHRGLELKKKELENSLKAKFDTREVLLDYEPVNRYVDYFKCYKKTYHVLQQIESVIFKGKSIPCGAALVEAMFMVELKNGLLTAGHDKKAITMPLRISIAKGDERYIGISGNERVTKPGDMIMYDGEGIVSSILGGPDFRTRILPDTRECVFVVYAPPGIRQDAMERHFDELIETIQVFAPEAAVEFRKVYDDN
jgi:DNA/RNA-binding domain of Phe-tRNA-synthetase-like protein